MKVYVVNLVKARRVISFLLVVALSVGATVGILFGIDTYALASAEAGRAEIRTVIIDPGHGGEDCGAIGAGGILEKDLNMAIADAMKSHLEEKGYTVVMTRTEDKMLYSPEENIKGMRKLSDLKNRCRIAAQYPSAILVSVHMNSFGDARYSGLQVYYSDGKDESRALAGSVQSKVKAEIQPENNRVIKNGKNLYILDKSPVTSILVECGFLSNAEECVKLSEKEYQNRLSFAIVCGIIEYVETK